LPEEEIWFVVSRATRLHAGPSVSSSITYFYPVGTELKLIAHERGWFQVSDPTSRQGWIYEKYYLDAIRGPGQTQLAVQDFPNPTRVAQINGFKNRW
jgi:SH3-like domain-containing protein